jgi:hypothetical protein
VVVGGLDLRVAQVAELLGVSAGTVKSTLSRAVAQLRELPGISELFMHAGSRPAASATIRKVRYAGN